MGWLAYQTWLLLLIAFILGCMTAWFATLFVPDPPDLDAAGSDAAGFDAAGFDGEAPR